jgi:spore maturation protein CgeB
MPHRRFIVAGPLYPETTHWLGNVRHMAHLPPQYHPLLYSSSELVLNLTRREMVIAGYSPSVRLFEAAACGATILSDNWAGMDEFFRSGEEILLASDREDVLRHLRAGIDPKIGARAQQRVLAEHSAAVRAREFEDAALAIRSPATASA